MAFTFSHAVVAPYLYRLTHHQLPLAPLVIGTMLPDLTRLVFPNPMAHHFSGMFSINLLCGVVLCIMWYKIYQPVLFDYLSVDAPNLSKAQSTFRLYLMALIGLLVGNFSHLFWDSFTHLDDRTWFGYQFLAQKISILNTSLYWHEFLQYATSILVLPWLYLGFKYSLKSLPKREIKISVHQKKLMQLHGLISILLATIIGVIYFILLIIADQFPLYWCMVQGFKYFCMAIFIYATVFCLCRHTVLKA